MASALTLRRRAAAAPSWTPASLPSVRAWWHANDINQADGTKVTSWTDRVGSVAMTQGTVSQQPTVSVSLNAQRGINFTAASSTNLLASSIGSIPTVGPVSCFIIWKPTSTATVSVFAVQSATNNGWRVSVDGSGNYNRLLTVANGVVSVNATNTRGTSGVTALHKWSLDGSGNATFGQNYYGQYDPGNATAVANAGATQCFVGGAVVNGASFMDGTVYDIFICSGVTADADYRQLALWANRVYGLTAGSGHLNTPASVTADTAAISNGTCIEPSIIYFPSGFGTNGYKYINGFVPLVGSNSTLHENPTINTSSDGNTWTSPAAKPLVATPTTIGNNSDPSLFDNSARDGKLYLLWMIQNRSTVGENGVFYRTSTDAVTWASGALSYTSGFQLITPTVDNFNGEPHMTYDAASGNYWLYTIDITATAAGANVFYRRAAATIAGLSSASTTQISILNARQQGPWHMGNVIKVGSKWVTTFSTQLTDSRRRVVYAFSSTDGLAWTGADHPIVTPNPGGTWDAYDIYRMTLDYDGATLRGWYTACQTGTTDFSLSQMVTVPIGEIP